MGDQTVLTRQALAKVIRWNEADVDAHLIPMVADILFALINRAARMCESGYAVAADIDAAVHLGSGLAQGPLEIANEIGLETVHSVLAAVFEATGDSRFRPAPILAELGPVGRFEVTAIEPATSPVRDDGGVYSPVGVCGTGVMASGIAEVFATAGHPVRLVGRTSEKAMRAKTAIHASLGRLVAKGRIREHQRDVVLDRIAPTDQVDGLDVAAIVVEAVAENLAVKQELFKRLDRVCGPGSLLATTTSTLSVAKCARVTSRPGAVIGLHFFNPAPVMRLVEVVSTVHTAPSTATSAVGLCRSLGMRAVHCGDRPGFIVNALILPYLNDAIRLVGESRVGPEEMDSAIRLGLGFPVGPLAMADIVGLDVLHTALEILHEAYQEPDLAPAASLRERVSGGFYGRKTGQGFYSYAGTATAWESRSR